MSTKVGGAKSLVVGTRQALNALADERVRFLYQIAVDYCKITVSEFNEKYDVKNSEWDELDDLIILLFKRNGWALPDIT